MCSPSNFPMPNGGRVALFPSCLVVYNFTSSDAAVLSQYVSAHPGIPVLFLATRFNREMFSQAETHNRTFVLHHKFIDRQDIDPVYPAMWMSEGDVMPSTTGNLTVTATDRGFRVDSLPPDKHFSFSFI